MDNIRSTATSESSVINEWEIYRDVTGEPSHGRVLGLGTGIKGKDVYGNSSSQICSKRCKETQQRKEKEWEERFNELKSTLDEFKEQMLQFLRLSNNVPSTTQNGDNELRDVMVNSQENLRKGVEDTNESEENENSMDQKIEGDTDDDHNNDVDDDENDDDD